MGTIAQCRGRDSKKAVLTPAAKAPAVTAPAVPEEAKRPEAEPSQPVTIASDDDERPAAADAETAISESARIALPRANDLHEAEDEDADGTRNDPEDANTEMPEADFGGGSVQGEEDADSGAFQAELEQWRRQRKEADEATRAGRVATRTSRKPAPTATA